MAEALTWLRSLPWDRLVGRLGELYLRTARKSEQDGDRDRLIGLYARELSKFPGDLVLREIEGYRGAFFPALDELRKPIEQSARLADRRLRIAALHAFISANGEPAASRPNERPTEAQHKRVADYVKQSRAAMNGTAEPTWTPEQIEALKRVDEVHGVKAHAKGGRLVPVSEILGKGQWRVEGGC